MGIRLFLGILNNINVESDLDINTILPIYNTRFNKQIIIIEKENPDISYNTIETKYYDLNSQYNNIELYSYNNTLQYGITPKEKQEVELTIQQLKEIFKQNQVSIPSLNYNQKIIKYIHDLALIYDTDTDSCNLYLVTIEGIQNISTLDGWIQDDDKYTYQSKIVVDTKLLYFYYK
jgi:hypothetical protein